MDKGTSIEKIPIILVTGFLGSGKTSLLKQILQEFGSSKRIAVVQNEFTPGRTDSVELESTGIPFNLLEINNGSVFCACLLDDFISRLGRFINIHRPEAIFLEATGLADPVSMAQILQSPEVEPHIYLGGILTVVDCLNFARSHKYLQRVRHQVQVADVLLLNKSDLVYPGVEIKGQLAKWNPFADQYITRNAEFDNLGQLIAGKLGNPGLKTLDKLKFDDNDSMAKPDIGSCAIRTQKAFSEESIIQFHNENHAMIFRMKGYVRTKGGKYLLIQSVFDKLKVKSSEDWTGPSEVIIMGPGVKPGLITKEFLKFGKNEKINS